MKYYIGVKYSIDDIITNAKAMGLEAETQADDSQKGLFYRDKNGELVEWRVANNIEEEE